MGGTTVKYPQPTQQEKDLQASQAAQIQQQTKLLQDTYDQQQKLDPILLQQAGIKANYDENGKLVSYEQIPNPQDDLLKSLNLEYLQTQLAQAKQAGASQADLEQLQTKYLQNVISQQDQANANMPDLINLQKQYLTGALSQQDAANKALGPMTDLQMKYLQNQLAQQEQQGAAQGPLNDLQMKYLQGILQQQTDANAAQPEINALGKKYIETATAEQDAARVSAEQFGKLQSITLEDLMKNRDLRNSVETSTLERTLKALKGELPVSPALEEELTHASSQLDEQFRRNLGPGYETSSPYQEAKTRWNARAEGIREDARRGDITSLSQLGFGEGASSAQLGLSSYNPSAGAFAVPNGNVGSIAMPGGGGSVPMPNFNAGAFAVANPNAGAFAMPSMNAGGDAGATIQSLLDSLMSRSTALTSGSGYAQSQAMTGNIGNYQLPIGNMAANRNGEFEANKANAEANAQMWSGLFQGVGKLGGAALGNWSGIFG